MQDDKMEDSDYIIKNEFIFQLERIANVLEKLKEVKK